MKLLYFSLFMTLPYLMQAQYQYPPARMNDQTDNYHGEIIRDPYRWLEDDHAEETKNWVIMENEVTASYFEKIPYIDELTHRLNALYNYPKYSSPFRKGDYYYYYYNSGLQNQSVLYRTKGLNGTPEIVLDPNSFSADGTTKLAGFSLSKNGDYAAVYFSKGGSDWSEAKILDMKSLKYLGDTLSWIKVSGAAWQDDGFYYSRYPAPEGSALASKNENHKVYYHRIGQSQDKDRLIFEDPASPQSFNIASTTDDEQYTILSRSDRGKGLDGNALFFMKKGEKTFRPIVSEISDFDYSFIDNYGDDFVIVTNAGAPNKKVMIFNANTGKWKTIIREKKEPLQAVSSAGGKLFVSYMQDVSTHVYVYDINGKQENEILMPGPGNAGGFGGERNDKTIFYTFTSFTYPSVIYSYNIASGKSTVYRKSEVDFNSDDYETRQVFYPSKDGTKIPMFIVYKKGLTLNSANPTLLYGYGGFNISLNPGFSPLLIPFLEQGGVYAQANLRGGGEYGEAWHEQGMKLKKQNVFDDFIAAGEYLIREKYCDSEHLALRGGSNGGLLVGAVINQRPDLAKVAIPQVGVMDMLRFQKFTIGWNWIADYGSSDNEAEFKVLRSYSPLHNIRAGVNYPATLVTTADHDDRVVPAHSFKYAATLQAVAGPSTTNPLLIRIDVNSGHGASNTKKNIETMAHIYAFIWSNMGFIPKFK